MCPSLVWAPFLPNGRCGDLEWELSGLGLAMCAIPARSDFPALLFANLLAFESASTAIELTAPGGAECGGWEVGKGPAVAADGLDLQL